jgi:hypothetical protein
MSEALKRNGIPAVLYSLLLSFALPHSIHAQLLNQNLALNQPVISSGPVWGGFTPAALTDGDLSNICHPLTDSGTLGYYFQIDLGKTYNLDRILLYNRADGCCPERLSDYGIQLYSDDGGDPGVINWSATIRADGSNSGASGVDTVTDAKNPSAPFAGRFIRIVNKNGAAYSPQVAEVQVFGAPVPLIKLFAADEDALDTGSSTTLRWEIVNATGARISPGLGEVSPTNGFIQISPTGTTTYTLTATNAAGPATATVIIGVGLRLAPPQITEFMADNPGILKDEDGEPSDWIELYNPNPYKLNLSSFYLTDDPAKPLQWNFPNLRIAPKAFLIVFASGKDRRETNGTLHTNFRLDAAGDLLALVNQDGIIIQQFPTNSPGAFPPQSKNASYGIGSNGLIGFLRPPTPEGTNGPAYEGVVADTKFTVDRGFYDTPLSVAITCATPDAVIRYTTDRTDPTATHGNVFSFPVSISKTTVLRAAAFKNNWSPSAVDTQTYIYLSNVISASVMNTAITRNPAYSNQLRDGLLDLPSVSITTTGRLNDTTEVKTTVEWIRPDGQPGFHVDCGVKQYGGAFTDFPKKSYRLYFRSEYGTPKLKYPVFEGYDHGLAAVDEFDQLELRSGSHDMSQRGFYMSNIFTDDTLLDMGQLNPHGRFVHLYENGTYWGVYHLRERWGAAMHQSYLGGSKPNYESINGNWNVGGWASPGSPYDGDGSIWEYVKSIRDNYPAVKQFLDVPEYVDYMLMWMFGGAEDEYRCVGPTVPGSGFKFYLNDADGWFCGPYYCAAGDRTQRGAPGRSPGDGPGSIFSMLFKSANPDYRTLLADRIYKALYNKGALTSAQNIARLKARTDEITRAFIAESARWNNLTPAEWAKRRDDALKNWLPSRTAAALATYRNAGFYPKVDAPVLNQQGGTITPDFQVRFTTPARGTIYYTTDGTDPRLSGGAISQLAHTVPGPLQFPANTLVKARVKDGTTWSALNEAFFQVGPDPVAPGDLVVSELNYDPTSIGAEFLELANISARAVNLRGSSFINGVTYRFPGNRDTSMAPGQRILLVKDLFRFQQQYGIDIPVAGIYSGNLSKNGERLALATPSTNIIFSFSYKNTAPWPTSPGSVIGTLVLSHPELGIENPAAWRASATPEGSPGMVDSSLFTGVPSEDLDSDGLPAILEYALGTSDDDPSSGPSAITAKLDLLGNFLMTFTRNLSADDVILSCEGSRDLVSWFPATLFYSQATGNGLALETWGLPPQFANALFLRLRVSDQSNPALSFQPDGSKFPEPR